MAASAAVRPWVTEGMTKILVDPETEQVLGVGIVGSGAGELIAEGGSLLRWAGRETFQKRYTHTYVRETVVFQQKITSALRPKFSVLVRFHSTLEGFSVFGTRSRSVDLPRKPR